MAQGNGRVLDRAELDELKARVDLAAVMQKSGLTLRPEGRNLATRCPFHADGETPNLIVSPAKGLWHCMACGAAGNAIQFVQRHDGVSFRHAFEVLAHGRGVAFTNGGTGPLKRCTVSKLPCPLDPEAGGIPLPHQGLTGFVGW